MNASPRKPMESDRLLGLLGHEHDDPAVEATLVDLRTRRRPELDPDESDAFYDWVCVRKEESSSASSMKRSIMRARNGSDAEKGASLSFFRCTSTQVAMTSLSSPASYPSACSGQILARMFGRNLLRTTIAAGPTSETHGMLATCGLQCRIKKAKRLSIP